MKRTVGMVLALVAIAPVVPAQAQDWAAVKRLRRGAEVIVEQRPTATSIPFGESCRLVRVDDTTLTCSAGPRLVFPRATVQSVIWRKKTSSFSPIRMILFAGLGFLLGGAITDENLDLPLALVGAAAGASYGAGSGTPHERLVQVYRRPNP